MTSPASIEKKVKNSIPLSREDGLFIFQSNEMGFFGNLANSVRERLNKRDVYFNVNRHLNLTNVCISSCKYCSFQRKPGESSAYVMRHEDALAALEKEVKTSDISEVHIVNGLHPYLPFKYYVNFIKSVHKNFPQVSIKAFTATEIHFFEKKFSMKANEVLDIFLDAGLSSITGGGAEIFNQTVRNQIVDHTTHFDDWSRIHKIAHRKNMVTPATMLYGHIESYEDRVDHMLRIRDIQDETNGFSVFVPLRYQFGAKDNPRNKLQSKVKHMASVTDIIKTFIVARLILNNVRHIKVFWVMHGLINSQLCLQYGADDIDGSVVEYKITKDADNFMTPEIMNRSELIKLIKQGGFNPVERATDYSVLRRY